jgi:putative hemolysin
VIKFELIIAYYKFLSRFRISMYIYWYMALAMRKICPAVDLLFDVRVAVLILLFFSSLSFSQYNSTYPLSCSIEQSSDWPNGIAVSVTYSYDSGRSILICSGFSGWYGINHIADSSRFVIPSDCEYKGISNAIGKCVGWQGYVSTGEPNCQASATMIEEWTAFASAFLLVLYSCSAPPPCANPAPTDSAAQALLAAKRAECDSLGGEYVGSVVQRESGSYCVEGECRAKRIGECPSDSGGINMLPKRFSRRQLYDEDSQMCREPPAEALRQKSGYYYNVKGQRLGSLMAGKPKARTPLYAREMLRGTMVEELFDDGYQNSDYLRDFLARDNVADSCGMKGGDNGNYGVIEVDGTDTAFIYGIACPRAQVKVSFDTLNYPLIPETNDEKCGTGQNMYRFDKASLINISMPYAEPQIFVVEAGFVFPGGRTVKQSEVDSIQKHEEGHKRDMECIIQKFPTQKVMFDGCFCLKELNSLGQQERDESYDIYADMLYKADSIYHKRYKNSGYPPEEEMDVCPDYIP